jgi:hypothetical protein
MVEGKMTKPKFKSLSLLAAFLLVTVTGCGSLSAQEVSDDVCGNVSELKRTVRGLRKIDGDTTLKEAGEAVKDVTSALGRVGESAGEFSKDRSRGVRESYKEFEQRVKERPDEVTINEAISTILNQISAMLDVGSDLTNKLNCDNAESESKNFESNNSELFRRD